MARYLIDSVNPNSALALRSNYPGAMLAGYVDGKNSKWPELDLVICEVLITTYPGSGERFNVIDCESEDFTPLAAYNTVLDERSVNRYPSIYCNRSTWPDVRILFQAAGVEEPPYWIATANNEMVIPPGAVAAQFKQEAGCDVSIVEDYWPGVDVVNPLQITDLVTFSDGTVYKLRGTGEVQASSVNSTPPAFHIYTIKGDDGSFYTFGPKLNNGVFAYPGLPSTEREGNRTFYEIRAGEGRW